LEFGVSKRKAMELINALSGGTILRTHTARQSYVVPPGVGNLYLLHRRYLESRGFDPDEIVRKWSVQGIGIAARLSWRLFIPVSYQGRAVSWTTRSVSHDARQRYISASPAEELMNHKHIVYGADNCNHSVVVVEGPVDAWRVGPGAGALFGTTWTSAQVTKLAIHPCRFICFDSSPEAQKRACELATELSAFEGRTEVVKLDAEDPGSASLKEIGRLRRHARL
jgi:hypothetical protein